MSVPFALETSGVPASLPMIVILVSPSEGVVEKVRWNRAERMAGRKMGRREARDIV